MWKGVINLPPSVSDWPQPFPVRASELQQFALWFNLAARQGDGSSAFYLSQMHLSGEGIEQDRVVARVWAMVAFAKGIEGAEQILTTLNEELTEEQMEQSVQILDEIFQKHPEMLGG